jgi:hypothetical protein
MPWRDIAIEAGFGLFFMVVGIAIAVWISEWIDRRQEKAAARKAYEDWMNKKQEGE